MKDDKSGIYYEDYNEDDDSRNIDGLVEFKVSQRIPTDGSGAGTSMRIDLDEDLSRQRSRINSEKH